MAAEKQKEGAVEVVNRSHDVPGIPFGSKMIIYPLSAVELPKAPLFNDVFEKDDIVFIINDVDSLSKEEVGDLLIAMNINIDTNDEKVAARAGVKPGTPLTPAIGRKLLPQTAGFGDKTIYNTSGASSLVYVVNYTGPYAEENKDKSVMAIKDGKIVLQYDGAAKNGKITKLYSLYKDDGVHKFGEGYSSSGSGELHIASRDEFINDVPNGEWIIELESRQYPELPISKSGRTFNACVYFLNGKNVTREEYIKGKRQIVKNVDVLPNVLANIAGNY